MTTSITITSKGQTTIPVEIRRKLGLDASGGVLNISFDEQQERLIVTKALKASDLAERFNRFIKPGTTPLTDVDAYYQAHREARAGRR